MDSSYLTPAVMAGKLQKVRQLVEQYGLSHLHSWDGGFALLCGSILNRHEEIAKLLLMKGCSIKTETEHPHYSDNTPLHAAVQHGYAQIVAMLLSRGADVDGKHEDGVTALHIAAMEGHTQIALLLAKYGATINAKTIKPKKGATPLHYAAKMGNVELVKLLLKLKADVNAEMQNGGTPLYCAIKSASSPTVQQLLNHGASFTANVYCTCTAMTISARTMLHHAAHIGNKTILRLLLNKSANSCTEYPAGWTPLHMAAGNGKVKAVRILLQCGARPHAKDHNDQTPLMHAVNNGTLDVVETLLKHDASELSTVGGRNPWCSIHLAAIKGHIKVIQLLLRYNDKIINCKDKDGLTPLHCAVKYKKREALSLLLELGADVNITTRAGQTALHYALQDLDEEQMIQTLTKHVVKIRSGELIKVLMHKSNDEINIFREECEVEVLKMMTRTISQSNVSLHDILSKNTNQLAGYFRNEVVLKSIEFGLVEFKKEFPIYGNMLEQQYKKGKERRIYLQASTEILNSAINRRFQFPYVCAERITSNLANADLTNIIRAKLGNVSKFSVRVKKEKCSYRVQHKKQKTSHRARSKTRA